MKINQACYAVTALYLILAAGGAEAQVKTGFAAGVGVGLSQVRDRDGLESFNANDIGYMLGAEYRFNNHFALGLNTFSLGGPEDEFNSVNTTIEVRGVDFVMRFIMPVSDGVEPFALAGGVVYTADLEPGGINSLFGEDAFEIGLGLDVDVGDAFAFRLAGRYFDGSRDESGALATVGFNYRF